MKPDGAEKTKTVTSQADGANRTALMASGDPQKVFTVEQGAIFFEASMMGVTRKFTLRRK